MGTDKKDTLPIYAAKRGSIDTNQKNVWDYSAVFYRTVMRTNYPISLVGLSFFGPAEGKSPVSYILQYEISMSMKPDYYFFWIFKRRNVPNPVLSRGKVTLMATPNEKFYVDLDKVNIPANTGIEIAFSLDGPKTRRMTACDTTIVVPTKRRSVRFELSQGSFQMPEIFFCMEEDKK